MKIFQVLFFFVLVSFLCPTKAFFPPKIAPVSATKAEENVLLAAIDVLLIRHGVTDPEILSSLFARGFFSGRTERAATLIEEAQKFYITLIRNEEPDADFLELIDGFIEGYAQQQAAIRLATDVEIKFANLTSVKFATEYTEGAAVFVAKDSAPTIPIMASYKHDKKEIILDLSVIIFSAGSKTEFNKKVSSADILTLADRIKMAGKNIRAAQTIYNETSPSPSRRTAATAAGAQSPEVFSEDACAASMPTEPTFNDFLSTLSEVFSGNTSRALQAPRNKLEIEILQHTNILLTKEHSACGKGRFLNESAFLIGFLTAVECDQPQRFTLLSSALCLYEQLKKHTTKCHLLSLANGFLEGSFYSAAAQKHSCSLAILSDSKQIEREYIKGAQEGNPPQATASGWIEATDPELVRITKEFASLEKMHPKAHQVLHEYDRAKKRIIINLSALAFITAYATDKLTIKERSDAAREGIEEFLARPAHVTIAAQPAAAAKQTRTKKHTEAAAKPAPTPDEIARADTARKELEEEEATEKRKLAQKQAEKEKKRAKDKSYAKDAKIEKLAREQAAEAIRQEALHIAKEAAEASRLLSSKELSGTQTTNVSTKARAHKPKRTTIKKAAAALVPVPIENHITRTEIAELTRLSTDDAPPLESPMHSPSASSETTSPTELGPPAHTAAPTHISATVTNPTRATAHAVPPPAPQARCSSMDYSPPMYAASRGLVPLPHFSASTPMPFTLLALPAPMPTLKTPTSEDFAPTWERYNHTNGYNKCLDNLKRMLVDRTFLNKEINEHSQRLEEILRANKISWAGEIKVFQLPPITTDPITPAIQTDIWFRHGYIRALYDIRIRNGYCAS